MSAIARHEPRRIPFGARLRTAAVAVVLRAGEDGPELLFVRRPRRAHDRWGGHVAFPGGLASADDANTVETARREAGEEVGLDLGEPVGALSELLTAAPGMARPMRVVPYVFVAPADASLECDSREVAAAEWIALGDLAVMRPRIVVHRVGRGRLPVRAMRLSIGTLWGLTLSMARELLRIARSTAK